MERSVRLGKRPPCITQRALNPKWLRPELSDGNTSICLPIFPGVNEVSWFQADIRLSTPSSSVFQVGVVTTRSVNCGNPATVVMSEVENFGAPFLRECQCGQHITLSRGGRQICGYQCFNHGLNDSVTVTVQFNRGPGINEKTKLKICEIAVYWLSTESSQKLIKI